MTPLTSRPWAPFLDAMAGERVGVVSAVDRERGRAAMVLLAGLRDGERLRVDKGKGTFAFRATQLRVHGDPIAFPCAGMRITFAAPSHLQEGDALVRTVPWFLAMLPPPPELPPLPQLPGRRQKRLGDG